MSRRLRRASSSFQSSTPSRCSVHPLGRYPCQGVTVHCPLQIDEPSGTFDGCATTASVAHLALSVRVRLPSRRTRRTATARSSLHRSDRGANRVDDADELVAHPIPRVTRRHRVIGPEIADADAGPGHPNQGIGRLDEPSVANGLERTSCAPYITVACIWAPSFDATSPPYLSSVTLSIQHAAPIRPSTGLTLDTCRMARE